MSSSTLPSSPVVVGRRKRIDVAIVGPPNAGKSQLLNVLTKSPVAAVSRKRHTTRSDLLGARTVGNTQIIFKDTPGFMKIENAKEERLNRDLIVTAAAAMQDVDFTLLVLDAARLLNDNYRHALVQLMIGAINSKGRIEECFESKEIVDHRSKTVTNNSSSNNNNNNDKGKLAIVLNKVDLVKPKRKLIDLAIDVGSMADVCLKDQFDKVGKDLDFEAMMKHSPIVFYVSAIKEDGTEDILDHLLSLATPCQDWIVQPGEATTMTKIEQVHEIIREKIYRCCHQEVPHSIRQVNRMFREVPKGIVIQQDLIVFTKSHQKLVVGKTLQRIKETAQKDLCKLFDCDVSLHLHVKRKAERAGDSSDSDYTLGAMSQSIL